jgi:riboflavin kinase/FMN adenylyltransferase
MTSGYLLINKPPDWTSFDVVKKTQNILKTKKIGHTGTLDPFATGLLILLVGKATKHSQAFTNFDKEYIATAMFGTQTDTGDMTGNVIVSQDDTALEKNHPNIEVTQAQFQSLIPSIISIKEQIPSKFSAIKIKGKPAYKLARKKADFDMPKRNIEIKDFELVSYDYPTFTYRVVVSKGTYIRTLTEQIAALFDTVAVTTHLQRTKIGHYLLSDAIDISDLQGDTHIHSLSFDISTKTSLHPCVTIGTFDGVHLGHRYLLTKALSIAKEKNTHLVVMTFDNHPREVLTQADKPFLITEHEKKISLMTDLGIEHITCLHFDKNIANIPATEFLEKHIIEKYHPQAIIIGHDNHFGVGRAGDKVFLRERSLTQSWQLIEIPPLSIDGTIPSSSLIRQAIYASDMVSVQKYLGRHYSICGTVVDGKKIGRTLGFPTLNIHPLLSKKIIPPDGVYFAYTYYEKKKYYGVTNIGISPTIKAEKKSIIETFLFDFSHEIYEQNVEIFFIQKIREEITFSDKSELISQINNDISYAKSLISKLEKETP